MELADREHCYGCAACKAVCSRNAISMSADTEGFLYPHISASLCVNCGACTKACQSLQQSESCKPLGVYAAKAKDDALRLDSSSGGIFSLLAKDVLARGGVVFGAAFDRNDWHVYHRAVDNKADLAELRGSKYVQSDIGECYRQVKEELKTGRDVLFSGTPCQIAGLRASLRQDCENLLLVDVVCHAVPSPLAWKRYLEKRAASVYNNRVDGLRVIRRVIFRRKNCGWKRYSMWLGFVNDMEYHAIFSDDPFMRGFLAELYNRPSCHSCPSKNLSSGSDITIADYWGIASKFPEMDDDKGTSLVLVNTDKGRNAFSALSENIVVKESDFNHAVKGNSAIVRSTIPHKNRSRFFQSVNKSDFDSLVNRLLLPPLKIRVRSYVSRILKKIGLYR